MEHYKKFLAKLSAKNKESVYVIIEKLISLDFANLDIKKLRGYPSWYRVRVGKIRIIYRYNGRFVQIIDIGFRKDAYK
ncbi:MAG: hypothetical protein A2V81_03195 [Candidatus Abawacabacteria bacterium RBG_16_42_10]|uniref:Plasmid stabilization protein n=1 Tax=Candidatus Abawacabacteria bacterium RBG_16_42_10 TaxID=1817814 RepID=A0A1F4XKF8_9BACT|nr:MAG: hypothetical protein A2V81_03195 [Candidatus Abawacabacteria bacterium RBG_16_42_10]